MKAKNLVLIFLVAASFITTALYADSESGQNRAYLGVMLDTAPLPDLLIKHLGLSPDQGIRIRNVSRNSPADKAGLQRDDIIIGFQGKDVTDRQEFVDSVGKTSVDTEVSLEIIHLGKRKNIRLKLERFEGEPGWKYPPEPEIVQSWQPGRLFQLRPGDEDWIQVPFGDVEANIKKFFKGLYCYHHFEDGESYTVIIEGNPNDEDTTITVRIDDTEYKTTVKQIDKLPEKYRATAKQDLKNAREAYKLKMYQTFPVPEAWQRYFGQELPPHLWKYYQPEKGKNYYEDMQPYLPPFAPRDRTFDKVEKKMQQLQQRMEELEKRYEELLDRFSDEMSRRDSEKHKSQEKQEI